MQFQLPDGPLSGEIDLPLSKSIANRYLIIAALAESSLPWKEGLGEIELPDDVKILANSLQSREETINIGMAGTAMRFLTAFYAVQEGKTTVLTGAERMKQRPIGDLVDALRSLGAQIDYVGEVGFPPLRIHGSALTGGHVELSAAVSSQFVSALMMIAPTMQTGLEIHLTGKVLSRPYIELTAACMRNCGVEVLFAGNTIQIPCGRYKLSTLSIETDWSAASYFYAIAAARLHSKFLLKGLTLDSPQGDSILAKWFNDIGVSSTQKDDGVEIHSCEEVKLPQELDFTDNPDLAQTFAFLAATLGQPLKLAGLDNLRLKETDRVDALKTELERLRVSVSVDGNAMKISGKISVTEATIKTYNDHRMAMSSAVLATQVPIEIENPKVVAKSFPEFWAQFNR